MSLADLDPILQSPKRLRAMAILHASQWAEFAFLQEGLNIAKADLSKQMKLLVDSGYVQSKRAGGRRGGTTWFRITKSGRVAFTQHRTALQALTEDVPTSTGAPAFDS